MTVTAEQKRVQRERDRDQQKEQSESPSSERQRGGQSAAVLDSSDVLSSCSASLEEALPDSVSRVLLWSAGKCLVPISQVLTEI